MTRDLTIEHIQPERVRSIWYVIKPMLESVLKRVPIDAILEDIYHQIMTKHVHLFISKHGGWISGVYVFEFFEMYGKSNMRVWLAYHDRKIDGRTIADFWPCVVGIAKENNCHRIVAESPRAFNKVVPELLPRQTLFVADLGG